MQLSVGLRCHQRAVVLNLVLVFPLLVATIDLLGQDQLDFNRDIRPILSENCFFCHGQDGQHRAADLRLDQRDDAITSRAIVPFDPDESEMIERVFSTDPLFQMPPVDSHRQLSDSDKQKLRTWIEQGAGYSPHWAYIAPKRPVVPEHAEDPWCNNPIDAFVLDQLNRVRLSPSPAASRETLIKRLYIDLLGLPPTPQAIAEFVNDPAPDAYQRLVDRLLQSPHYGERMALAWLDAARYADSNGFQQDGDTWQWMWRDWVVQALNDNMPFDRFSIWQLAGDLLENATVEQKIASAFNRNHLLNGEGGAIPEEQRFVVLFDRVDTTATNWLGLTIACAQCHDHKYDPFSQKEYYQLLDIFNRVPEQGVPQYFSARIRVDTPFLELPSDENSRQIEVLTKQIGELEAQVAPQLELSLAAWRIGLTYRANHDSSFQFPDELLKLLRVEDADRTDAEREELETALRKYFDKHVLSQIQGKIVGFNELSALRQQLDQYRKDQVPRVMIMSDAQPRTTHVLHRGIYESPLEAVEFDVPQILSPLPNDAPRNRLGFAQWLFSPDHPLTARVQVNRIWQHFFGSGLVKTAEDFGVQSEYPSHLELLDWLAVEFREKGWNTKHMHRLIVTSATYQQSSRVDSERFELDPENRYFSRGARFRMPAMLLRDWALAAAGLLDSKLGGKPVYPYQPEGVWESLAITKERDFTYPPATDNDLYRRSLYTFWRRTVSPANMFDASSRQACRVRSSISNTPLHALTMLNDPTWIEAARVLAEHSMQASANLQGQISLAFERVLCRIPTESEQAILENTWLKQYKIYQQHPALATAVVRVGNSQPCGTLDEVELAALANVCLAIFNLDEAVTRE
ncbi:MAG TPA: PSD1 and planctomycete cytochrome C domain-containing protein [Pirellulaceae bacterium]|nr:PSD1 and planctomycete cytochrome C domain-containing protein [Pirellulaceae bacterium]HMO94137.1 PSD1 and planctomycete cytochrome C domain-containing protein [Pirellulaceae bacterium]HMP71208.1 PSD1 and planctomycete cytochrome C domain-containing protein [Pirellulaceae bacterium]